MKKNPVIMGTLALTPVVAPLLSPSLVHAEETNRLDQIVVSASRVEESIASIPGTVQVIDAEQIQQQTQAGQNLSDALGKLLPSFGVASETNTNFSQTLRGRDALILIDGVSQYDNRNINRRLQSISPDAVERIEVISGSSAVYGAGGAGGIINIITKRPEKGEIQFSTDVGITTSTEEPGADSTSYKLNQTVSGGGERVDYLVSGTFEKTNGFYDSDGNRIAPEPAQTSADDTDSYDILAKLGFDINEEQRLVVNLQSHRDEQDSDYGPNYGGPGVPALLNPAFQPAVVPVVGLQLADQPKTNRDSISLDFSDKDFLGTHFRAQAYYREREYSFFPFGLARSLQVNSQLAPAVTQAFGSDRLPVTGVLQSTSESESAGLKLTFEKDVTDTVNLVWGADYTTEEGKQTAALYGTTPFIQSGGLVHTPTGTTIDFGPSVETTTLAAFLQSKIQATDSLSLRFGVRYEDINQDVANSTPPLENLFFAQYGAQLAALVPGSNPAPGTLTGAELDYDEFLFNTGVSWQINDSNEVFANYSEGFELADLSRILRDVTPSGSLLPSLLAAGQIPPATNVGDTNLEAVKVKSVELGWRGYWDSLSLNASVYHNRSDRTPAFLNNQTVVLLDQKREITGFELAADYDINEDWSVGGTYSQAEGTTENNTLGRDLDLSPAEVAPLKFTSYGEYATEKLSVRLQGTHVGEYDYDRVAGQAVQRITSRSYTTWDLLTGFKLPVGNLGVAIQNLTNKDYQTVYSQWAAVTFSPLSGIPARGRTLSLSYQVDY